MLAQKNLMDRIEKQQSKFKLLLISDDESDVTRTSKALEQFANNRWHLDNTNLLSDGINRLRQEDTTVVLLDLYLPDSRGSKTFKTLHAAEPTVPIVVLTNLEDQVIGWHTTRCGAADHLLKGHLDEFRLPQVLDGVLKLHHHEHANYPHWQRGYGSSY